MKEALQTLLGVLLAALLVLLLIVTPIAGIYYGVLSLLVIVVDNPNLTLWQKVLGGFGWAAIFLGGFLSGLASGLKKGRA